MLTTELEEWAEKYAPIERAMQSPVLLSIDYGDPFVMTQEYMRGNLSRYIRNPQWVGTALLGETKLGFVPRILNALREEPKKIALYDKTTGNVIATGLNEIMKYLTSLGISVETGEQRRKYWTSYETMTVLPLKELGNYKWLGVSYEAAKNLVGDKLKVEELEELADIAINNPTRFAEITDYIIAYATPFVFESDTARLGEPLEIREENIRR